jgi:hypothetical protein
MISCHACMPFQVLADISTRAVTEGPKRSWGGWEIATWRPKGEPKEREASEATKAGGRDEARPGDA